MRVETRKEWKCELSFVLQHVLAYLQLRAPSLLVRLYGAHANERSTWVYAMTQCPELM
jgi:hypothetical protein